MAILEKFWVIDSLFPTKIIGVDQILQFQPNFTILEYLEYLELESKGNFGIFAMFFKSCICHHTIWIWICWLDQAKGGEIYMASKVDIWR